VIPYLLIGLAAAVITFVTTPAVRWLASKLGAIDHPNDRKVHANPTPTLGGLAILFGIVGAGFVASTMPEFEGVFAATSEPLGILLAGLVIFVLGAVDDFHDLPAPVKLAGQVFASGILFLAGVKMQGVLLPDQYVVLSDDVSVIVTVVWLVAMINAMNLVDGLDGLAAGLAAIAAAAFFVFSFQLYGDADFGVISSAPLVAIVIVGAALGFLRHNFHPARIFMGDCGAMLLGLVLGAATVAGIGNAPPEVLVGGDGSTAAVQSASPSVFLAYFPLLIPLMVLAIPILDALFAIVRRARRRRSVFHADKEHIHHRLMDLGHGHRQAVLVLYIWAALAAGAGLAYSFLDEGDFIFALPVAVGAVVIYTLFPLLTKFIQGRIAP
jgi:UDP-GlcNAc:undecaprenyl-phosphate/decaprenyl-phosphate GlcNAc-1-phosphate transferase